MSNLIKLNAGNNSRITNINHMHKMMQLIATYHCGINNNSIKKLNLLTLDAGNNKK